MQNILRTSFDGDINLGLHGFATDKYCLLGTLRHASKVKNIVGVKPFDFQILNMDLLKIFVTGNSSGIVVPKILDDFDDLEKLKDHFEVLVLKTHYSSIGNLLMMNDKGVILSPLLKKHRGAVERFFGLPCEVTTIAGLSLVGSLGFATNKGCLLSPKVKEREKKIIEKVLGVDADITTVNFGSPYPGAGIIANSNGLIISNACSGPEMGRITDVLGFLG
jgi:translation initiation factor 6